MDNKTEVIFLGGGCFWCLEAVFNALEGVITVTSGYMGGSTENPTYSDVCSGATGHAEVIKVEFREEIVNLKTLLTFFLKIHDPTTLNRQGADIGTQYRSAIFCVTNQQKELAKRVVENMEKSVYSGMKIVTEIILILEGRDKTHNKMEVSSLFWKAENYHQNYFFENEHVPYCQTVILPKLKKAKELVKEINESKQLRSQPTDLP